MVAHPNDKKIAFITGANRGIGFAVARQLGRRGMAVIIGARDPQRGADTATALRGEGIDAHHVRLDVTDEHTIRAAVQEVEHAFSRLDVLVNNAGVALDRGMQPSEVPLDYLQPSTRRSSWALHHQNSLTSGSRELSTRMTSRPRQRCTTPKRASCA